MSLIGTITTHESGGDLVIKWQIPRFSTLRKDDCAEYFSPDFSFGGEEWYLMIFPNGASEYGTSGHVDITFSKYSSGRPIRVTLSLSLETAKGERDKEEHVTKDFQYFPKNMHEILRFISRAELTRRRSALLPDDVLTVVCTMRRSTPGGSGSTPKWYWPFSQWKRKEKVTSTEAALAGIAASPECCPALSDPVSETVPASSECCHCKENFATGSLSSHQRKCMQRPVKCPDCLKVVVLQKWFDEHQCQMEILEAGAGLEGNSENVCVETSAQTEKENGEEFEYIFVVTSAQTRKVNAENDPEQNSENTSVEPCTQMDEKSENSKRIYVNASTQTGEENEERDWMTDVLDFLKAGNGIDVTFEVETPNGHVEFFAHKLILAMKSPFFADEFYGEGKTDAHLVIPLKGINPKAFMEMLRYCYDNKLRMRTIEEACVLFKVASDFKILNLQKLCHTFIKDAKLDP